MGQDAGCSCRGSKPNIDRIPPIGSAAASAAVRSAKTKTAGPRTRPGCLHSASNP